VYNKLFTKILDSSVWLEDTTTRIVWLTFLAAMDEDGFAQFASPLNLAHRARVTPDEASKALEVLEGPDTYSGDPEHEGRRIERVDGGWIILNSSKYRALVTREVTRMRTRERVARFRSKNKTNNGTGVTQCNAENAECNASVTPSEAHTEAAATKTLSVKAGRASERKKALTEAEQVYGLYPRKVARPKALAAIAKAVAKHGLELVLSATQEFARAWAREPDLTFCPHPATWFHQERFLDEPSTWVRSAHAGAPAKSTKQLRDEVAVYLPKTQPPPMNHDDSSI